MEVYKVLSDIQKKIKVSKEQRNSFGNYNYRSCEDILSELKPLLPVGYAILLEDDIQLIGDRFYIKSTASISNGLESVKSIAFAREELTQRGMSAGQLTGATSSYARKYALGGLLGLDDEKDADATNKHDKAEIKQSVAMPTDQRSVRSQSPQMKADSQPATDKQLKAIFAISKAKNIIMPTITTFEEAKQWISQNGQR